MLRFVGKGKDGKPLIGVGLSEVNVELLKQGKPIRFDLSDIPSGALALEGSVVIFYGKTEAEMEALLRRAGLITPETIEKRIGR